MRLVCPSLAVGPSTIDAPMPEEVTHPAILATDLAAPAEATPSANVTVVAGLFEEPRPTAAAGLAAVPVDTASTSPSTSVDDFISSISVSIVTLILSSRPKLWVSHEPDYSIVPRRSLHLTDKPKASNPEVQATRVMLKKLGKDDPPPPSDESGARRFKETFGGALSSTKKEAMRELFPAWKRFGSRRAPLPRRSNSFMDQEKLLYWNVHGLNSRARRSVVRNVMTSEHMLLLCLQETKVHNFPIA